MVAKLQDIDPEALLNHGQHDGLRELLANYKIDKPQALLLIESYILTSDYRRANKLLDEWKKQLEIECPGKLMYFKTFFLEKEKDHEEIQLLLRNQLKSINVNDEIDKAWLLLALSRSLYFFSINLVDGGIYTQEAINIFSRHNMIRPESYAWQLLGSHRIKVKDYHGAEEAFLKALDLRRNLNNPQLIGQTATSLASAALKSNRYLSARNYFFTALEEGYRLRPGTTYKLCQTWYNIGVLSYKMAELEASREAFQLAMINARKNQYLFLPDILYYLGRIESFLNQPHQSKFYYKQALITYERSILLSDNFTSQILRTLFFYLQQLILINNKDEFYHTYQNYTKYLNSSEGKIYKTFIDIFLKEFEVKTSLSAEFYEQILFECKKIDTNRTNTIVEHSLSKLSQFMLKRYFKFNNTDNYVSLNKLLAEQYQYAMEQNNLSLQIQTLFCRAILNKIHNTDLKTTHEDFKDALELASNSELPWHYGFITKYSNWIIKSNHIDAEKRTLLIKLLEECFDNFLVVINNFIGSIK